MGVCDNFFRMGVRLDPNGRKTKPRPQWEKKTEKCENPDDYWRKITWCYP
jgi:hypothetical protein